MNTVVLQWNAPGSKSGVAGQFFALLACSFLMAFGEAKADNHSRPTMQTQIGHPVIQAAERTTKDLSEPSASSYQKDAQPASSSSRPNILWIYVEDTNDWMGAYGDFTIATPAIDELAKHGVRFDKTIMPGPVCSVVRSALMVGDMPTTVGVHNHRSARTDMAPFYLKNPTVAEVFRMEGYATFNIGKDDYNFTYDRDALYSEHLGSIFGYQGTQSGPEFDWSTKLKGRLFFGQIQLRGGKHDVRGAKVEFDSTKMQLPPYYPDLPSIRKAWAEHYHTIGVTDQEVEGIINTLKNSGLYENTAVFLFSDHGMKLLRHKQFLYDGGVRVPFIVSWPRGNAGLRKLGAVRKELTAGLDITGTSLALAGIEIPSYMTSRDLFSDDYKARTEVVSTRDRCDATFDRIRSIRTENFKYIRNFMPARPYMQPQYRDSWALTKEYRAYFAAGGFNLVQAQFMAATRPSEELYDLREDPHEINNLVDHPDYEVELRHFRKSLTTWIDATGDRGQHPESEESIQEVIGMWGDDCVSQECEAYRQRNHAKKQ